MMRLTNYNGAIISYARGDIIKTVMMIVVSLFMYALNGIKDECIHVSNWYIDTLNSICMHSIDVPTNQCMHISKQYIYICYTRN